MLKHLLILYLLAMCSRAYAESLTLHPEEKAKNIRLGPYLALYEGNDNPELAILDPAAIAQLADTAFRAPAGSLVNYGVVNRPMWARFVIENLAALPRSLVIASKISIPIVIYQVKAPGDGGLMLHDLRLPDPEAKDELLHLPSVSLNLEPGLHTFLVKTEGDFGTLDLSVWDPGAYHHYVSLEQTKLGAVFGMFVILLVTNLLLALTLRKNYYFYYIGYIAFHILFVSYVTGTNHVFFSTGSSFKPDFLILASTECFLVNLFTISFFQSRINLPRLHRIFLLVSVGYIASIALRVINPYVGIISFLITLYVGISIAIAATAIQMWKGSRPAWFFCAGWVLNMIGSGIFGASRLGFINVNEFTEGALLWGSLWEMIILSLAVGDRYFYDAKQRENQFSLMREAKNQQFLRLAGEVAHEVNNPLTIISGYSSLAEKVIAGADFDASSIKRILQKIHANSRRIERVVSMLRNIAESGKSKKVSVNVETMFAEAWQDCQESSELELPHLNIMSDLDDRTLLAYPVLMKYAFGFLLHYAALCTRSVEESSFFGSFKVGAEGGLSIEISFSGVHDKNAIDHSFNQLQLALGPFIETILDIHGGKLIVLHEGPTTRYQITLPRGFEQSQVS